MNEPRVWFARRVEAYRLGLLEGEELARFESLRRSDDECEQLLASRGEDPHYRKILDAGHIPPELLARWPRTSERLSGVTRAAVRRHLKWCEVCAGALRVLGYEAVLPVDQSRELDEVSEARVFGGASKNESPDESGVASPRALATRRAARSWLVPAWAALATAAALALLLVRPPEPDSEGIGVRLHQLGADGQAQLVHLESVRGAVDGIPTSELSLEPDSGILELSLGQLLPLEDLAEAVPGSTLYRIELSNESSWSQVVSTVDTATNLAAGRSLFLVHPEGRIPEGSYLLRLQRFVPEGDGLWRFEEFDPYDQWPQRLILRNTDR